jgi:hypothetical protein
MAWRLPVPVVKGRNRQAPEGVRYDRVIRNPTDFQVPGRIFRMKLFPFRRWLALCLCLAAGSPLCAQTVDLGGPSQSVVKLDGLWRFHPGDNPGWSAPDFNDSEWPLLSSDRPWTSQGYPSLSGYAWYRFTVRVPAGSRPVSILLPEIFTGYTFFEEGRRIGRFGAASPSLFVRMPKRQLLPLTEEVAAVERTLHLAIRVWHAPVWAGYEPGGSRPGGFAGDAKLLTSLIGLSDVASRAANVDLYVDSVLRAIVGLVILGLFLLRRGDWEYFWFAAIQLFGGADDVLGFLNRSQGTLPIQINDLLDAILAGGFWLAGLCFFAALFPRKQGQRRSLWFRISLVLIVLSPLATPLYWPGWISVPAAGLLGSALVLPSLLWVIGTVAFEAWRGNRDARLLLMPVFLVDGFYLALSVTLALWQFGLPGGVPDLIDARIVAYPFPVGIYTLFNILFLVALLAFLIRRFALARGKEEHLEGQLEAARQVQQILVPEFSAPVPGFRIESVYLPAESVGGDFFQQLQDAEGRLLLVVGDVAGKGLPAAMMVSMLVGAIRTEARHTSDPVALLAALNDRMLERMEGRGQGGFATCLAARLSPDGWMEIANAGHIPPWRHGKAIDLPGSLPLGIVANAECACLSLQLQPEDSLVFVSDGVLEAQSPAGELFGFDRIAAISRESAAAIAQAAQEFGQEDDITVVVVKLMEMAQSAPIRLH